ncbi:NLR, CARD domain-containing protein 3 [Perkinsus chesapeaki]|uniref:NLR, CARD domain-containing protein 3 n=1 Tax=Perkinsus chesapeaki TaxID=330153 RepID=A0A7J6LUP2_PERCH|nr:NLR, CARD domain-containing protein 3 [Perkinsus chesapeaki]
MNLLTVSGNDNDSSSSSSEESSDSEDDDEPDSTLLENAADTTSPSDPFRLHYKLRNTGWLVRFMHTLSLGDESTLKPRELAKVSRLRAEYLRAEFAANAEATMTLSILRSKVFEYLIDLDYRIRLRRPNNPKISIRNSRASIGFIRPSIPGLKGKMIDLTLSENRVSATDEANYDNYWQMYHVSEQTKYMTRRDNGKQELIEDNDDSSEGDSSTVVSGSSKQDRRSSGDGDDGSDGQQHSQATFRDAFDDDSSRQQHSRHRVLSKLSRKNWPTEALNYTLQTRDAINLTNNQKDRRTRISRTKSVPTIIGDGIGHVKDDGFDTTLAVSKSRMMHVCDAYTNGDEGGIDKMPVAVKRKLKARGLLGSQLMKIMEEETQRPDTSDSAATVADSPRDGVRGVQVFKLTEPNQVDKSVKLPKIQTGAQRYQSATSIKSMVAELNTKGIGGEGERAASLRRSLTVGALQKQATREDLAQWREFTKEGTWINPEAEKLVRRRFKYPGCLAFFEAVRVRGLPPTPLPVLAGPLGVNDLMLSNKGLSDRELEAIITGAVEIRSQPLKRLLLNRNSLSDKGFVFLLDSLEKAGWLDLVECIDLNDNIGLGTDTIRAVGRLLQDDLVPKLVVLRLSGINITDYAYTILLEGLDNEIIEELDLSYTGLGRWSNQGPMCVGDMILRLEHLKVLDISGNHLNHMALDHIGFALAEVDVVTSLSCSNNSGLLTHSLGTHFARSGYLGKAGLSKLEECVGRKALVNCYPCMNILCSYLGSIATIEYVDLRNSQLNYQSAFVLADSLCIHPNIRTVLVANNPIGADGIRALLRLMYLNPYPPDRLMYFIDLDRCEYSAVDDSNKGDDGGGDNYGESGTSGGNSGAGGGGGSGVGGANYNFLDPSGSYRLHMENPYNRAVARQCLRRWQVIQDTVGFSDTFYEIRHNGMALTGFELDEENVWQLPDEGMLTYTAVYRQKSAQAALDPRTLNDDPTRTIRKRLSEDLFQRLMRWYGQDVSRRPIIEALSKDFAVEAFQVTKLFDASVTSELKVFLLETFLDKILDPAHALSLMEYLAKVTIFRQQVSLPQALGIGLPKKKKLGKRLVYPIDVKQYFVFSGSNPSGHYKLDLKTADHYMVAEHLVYTNRWDVEWCKAKGRPDVSQYGNYQCFRNEHIDGVPFKYGQDWSLPGSGTWEFDYVSPHRAPKGAAPITAEAWLRVIHAIQTALDEAKLSPEVIIMCLRRVSHHFYVKCAQVDNLLAMFPPTNQTMQLRRDIFIILYNRIIDYVNIRDHFCRSRMGLPPQFGPSCVVLLEHRLGKLNLLNPLRADNSIFVCHFGTHEGRVLAQIVLRLKKAEDSRFINSRIGTSPEVSLPMDPPQDWYRCVPFEGFWEVTYVCDESSAKMNLRKEIAVAYCAYEF